MRALPQRRRSARASITGRARAATASLALALACTCGCGTTKISGTQRTATEQLLLTNAWDDALRQVDFRGLAGVPVYLDSQYLDGSIDKGWLVSSIRQSLLAHGALLRSKPEQAQWIVEARVGTYGTNDHNLLLGIPQMTIPVGIAGLPTGTIPEVPLAKKSDQQGVVKVALYAFDRASGQVTWTSGTQLASSTAKDTYIGGIGPIQSGSIRQGTQFVGVQLPSLGVTGEAETPAATRPTPEGLYQAPEMAMPSPELDLESFAP